MDVIVYSIPQVAVVRIGAKEESVEAKRRDYEKRFPGEENWVAYAGSEKGTLEIAGGGRGATALPGKVIMAPPVVFEQLTYFFEVEFDAGLEGLGAIGVRHYLAEFTDSFISRGRFLHGQFSFVNEPGTFRFEVFYEVNGVERSFGLEFLVASTKMDVKKDYREILREVESEDRALVFADKAKTLHDVQAAGAAEADAARRWVVYFTAALDVYERAVKRILHEPHDRMIDVARPRRADQVRRWSPAMAREYARRRGDGAELARHVFVESVREMTFDTMENRFVKHTLGRLAEMLGTAAKAFAGDAAYDATFRAGVAARAERFRRYVRDPKFAGVGRFRGGANSLVMQMRPGYSDIRVVWTLMNSLFTTTLTDGSARRPSVGLAKLSALYEFWCFIRVREILAKILKEAFGCEARAERSVADARTAVASALLDEDADGVPSIVWSYRKPGGADGEKVAEVVFQQSYGAAEAGDEAFAEPFAQRPDIVVRLFDAAHEYTYLFDAKYQIENGKTTGERDAASRAALDQMHRYRDAILWRAREDGAELKREVVGAYILYPADEAKGEAVFDYGKLLAEQNIGAFPLLPGREARLTAHLESLVKKLDWGAATSAWLLKERQVIPQRGLYYTDADVGVVDEARVLDVVVPNAHLWDWAMKDDIRFYPVLKASVPSDKDVNQINRLRLTFPDGSRRLLQVGAPRQNAAAYVVELFDGMPDAKGVFAPGLYLLYPIEGWLKA
jgi:hypothetical protein